MSTASAMSDSNHTQAQERDGELVDVSVDGQVRDMTPAGLERMRAGDAEAARLFDAIYRERLHRFCWGYLRNAEAADDAVQDVLHNVLRASDVPTHLRAWIYKIARHHCSNVLRSQARRRDGTVLTAPSQVDAALTGQLTRLVREEDLAQVRDLVLQLSATHQEVLRLRYVEGLAYAEIAEVLEVAASIAKSRVFEAMKKLREAVAQMERREESGEDGPSTD